MSVAHRPSFSAERASAIAREMFAIEGAATPLPSERDQNFSITTASGDRWTLKISSAIEERALLEMQNMLLGRLASFPGPFHFPEVHPLCAGDAIGEVAGAAGTRHHVRLLSWVPGVPLARCRPHSPRLMSDLGRMMGMVSSALDGVQHPAAVRSLQWDLRAAVATIGRHQELIRDPSRRALLERLTGTIAGRLGPRVDALRTGLIHNDANDFNVLVRRATVESPRSQVCGLIDLGDAIESWLVAEPAVAIAYAILGKEDPAAVAATVAAGYHAEHALTEAELEVLFDLATLRLCLSVANAAAQTAEHPDDPYLAISEQPAWTALAQIADAPTSLATYRIRGACGLEPCPEATGVRSWLVAHAGAYSAVVEPDVRSALVFDLSVGSLAMGNGAPGTFTAAGTERRLFDRMTAAGAAVGFGRYDETRCWYGGDLFAAPAQEAPRRRTVHLGVDLFLPAGAPVFSPLPGRVASSEINAGELDYGPTLILEHRPEDGVCFYTLYGHLSAESIAGLRPGDEVAAGEQIARIGAYPDNGNWAPHLHLQLIVDRLGYARDYPGVCAPDERAIWLSLSPDPNLLLGIPPDRLGEDAPDADEILRLRATHLGPSLSVSYRQPLHIVRGFGQTLYDIDGQPFLDAVNNVPHVGHSHPRVVAAARQQSALLNTNTRYLHATLARYAQRLAATLPTPLEVCYFLCSGSEANELAVRLARTYTGRRDLVVLDGAYHGNTSLLIDASPYKHAGPGGRGKPDWVQVAAMPDPYRARCGDRADCATQFAEQVREACARSRHGIAGFLAEPLLGCGGQVIPPPGYLAAAFEHVRAAGGVAIADEVQIGFGRSGTHFWAFESQGAVPDIVTLGKPIGNGFPLAAVVTTREIADAFANGMEYFNTFGGNPVACAVGMAVLDVLEQEHLQANAHRVGSQMLAGLGELQGEHDIIGDVRGLGFYLGVELVRDRSTLEPAGAEAAYVANRMRDHGILVSTDGPLHNVLKIKPPMCFDEHDADRLVATLDRVLGEDLFR